MSTALKKRLAPFVQLALVCIVTIGFTPALHAQLRGAVSGTAVDAQSAVVDGVQVRITNLATGEVHNTRTNEAGFYRLTTLDPGTYAAEFKKEGFDTLKTSAFEVRSGKDTTVDAHIKVGAISNQVEVT